jgi:hypothetical protein
MSDAFLFIWGLLALTLAVGPLLAAAILDRRESERQGK